MTIELTEEDLRDSLTYLANYGAMVVDGKATAGGLRATVRWLSKRKGQKIYHKSLADKLQARFGEQYRKALYNRGVAPIVKEYINSNELPEIGIPILQRAVSMSGKHERDVMCQSDSLAI